MKTPKAKQASVRKQKSPERNKGELKTRKSRASPWNLGILGNR